MNEMSYEEYDEAVMNLLSDPFADDSELDELDKQYPEHAARMKREADARRGCTYEEYQAQLEAANPPEEKSLFAGNYKKNDMFEYEEVWYIAEEDGVYQDAADLEDGFDIFLPHSGHYTVTRKATSEEIKAHLDAIALAKQRELEMAGLFSVGQRIRRKGTKSNNVATVVNVDLAGGRVQFQFDGVNVAMWDAARYFEVC